MRCVLSCPIEGNRNLLFVLLNPLTRSSPRTRSPRRSSVVPVDLRRDSSSQERPNGYEEYGADSKFKWDIVPLDPSPRAGFEQGGPTARLLRRIPIGRITSSRGTVSRSPLTSRLLVLFQRPLLGVPCVRQTVSSRGVIPKSNKLHIVDRHARTAVPLVNCVFAIIWLRKVWEIIWTILVLLFHRLAWASCGGSIIANVQV